MNSHQVGMASVPKSMLNSRSCLYVSLKHNGSGSVPDKRIDSAESQQSGKHQRTYPVESQGNLNSSFLGQSCRNHYLKHGQKLDDGPAEDEESFQRRLVNTFTVKFCWASLMSSTSRTPMAHRISVGIPSELGGRSKSWPDAPPTAKQARSTTKDRETSRTQLTQSQQSEGSERGISC